MRLTNKLREEILTRVLTDILSTDIKEINIDLNALIKTCHAEQYGADIEKMESLKFDHDWFTRSSTIRLINPNGKMAVYIKYCERSIVHQKLYVRHSVIQGSVIYKFPPQSQSEVEIKTQTMQSKADQLRQRINDLFKKEHRMWNQLHGFLHACKTKKELLANMPEAEKYLPQYEAPKKLPIPLVDDIRKELAK